MMKHMRTRTTIVRLPLAVPHAERRGVSLRLITTLSVRSQVTSVECARAARGRRRRTPPAAARPRGPRAPDRHVVYSNTKNKSRRRGTEPPQISIK